MAPIKSSLAKSATKLLGVFRDRDLSLRGFASSLRTSVFDATGGTTIESGGSKYHVFTSSGAFNVNSGAATNIEVLVVAGGGSGGTQHGGGGGGGTVVHTTSQPVVPGSYTVTVGDGGGAASPPYGGKDGENGGLSQFGSSGDSIYIISKGGGYGAGYQKQGGAGDPSTPGGTGGGGSGQGGPRQGGTGTAPSTSPGPANTTDTGGKSYFNDGGDAPGSGGGGGSGAGENGDNCEPSPGSGGQGGDGQAFPGFPAPVIEPAIPSPVRPSWTPAVGPTGIFAGGGGGAGHLGPNQGSPGGTGGGGDGAPHVPGGSSPVSDPGVDFTGGGGGGSGANDRVNGLGGKGLVIVKYTT